MDMDKYQDLWIFRQL